MSSERVPRRAFLRAAAGSAAAATATGVAGAQEGEGGGSERPDFGGYLDGIEGGYEDARGESSVTVEVGAGSDGLAFGPAGLWVDTGTTVTWEWTGEGGGHSVTATSGAEFDSGTHADAGYTFEHTFEEGGIVEYVCLPHEALGMIGAVAVGGEVPTVSVGGGGGGEPVDPEEMGVPFQAHFVGVATILGIVVSLVFTFFFLKYGETPHSGYPEED